MRFKQRFPTRRVGNGGKGPLRFPKGRWRSNETAVYITEFCRLNRFTN